MPSTQKTGIAPCGIIAWQTLGLLGAIDKAESKVLDRTQRADLANLLQEAGDNARELWRRELLPLGLRLFERTLDRIDQGVVVAEPQDSDLATWEPALDGVPPLWRPDVPMIGSARFQVIPDRRLA